MRLQPLAACPRSVWQNLLGVFTDIDDTLTTNGRLPAEAYGALEAIRDAGLLVVPITGRPAGWCDLIARTWPVDGVVGENGAFYFRYDPAARRMIRRFHADATTRSTHRSRLVELGRKIVADVPGAAIAADQAYRETDLAIDFAEDVSRLDPDAIVQIVKAFESAGATAKVSSIHVNGWFGTYDKLTMTATFMEDVFGIKGDALAERYAFVGDSPNDAPMFGYFANSIGVANVMDFANDLPATPKWLTQAPRGAGFAEFARTLIAARQIPNHP